MSLMHEAKMSSLKDKIAPKKIQPESEESETAIEVKTKGRVNQENKEEDNE